MKLHYGENEEFNYLIVEWINGERIPLEDYEERINHQINMRASSCMLQSGNDFDWIFGIV